MRAKDYSRLREDMLSSELVERISAAGLPCEVALRTGLEDRDDAQLTVLEVDISGDGPIARVRGTAVGEAAPVDTIRMTREASDWKIASLSNAGSTEQ